MINHEQYLLLKEIYEKGETIALVDNYDLLCALAKQGYCTHTPIDAIHHFYKNSNTLSAIIEYENFIKDESRKDKTVQLAEEANKKAKHANIISWFAFGAALIAAVASIVVPIVIKVYFS